MEEDSIQSAELNESEQVEHVLKYNETDSLDSKILSIHEDFDNRFAEREKTEMNLDANFFRNYYILALLSRVKSIEDSLEASTRDRVSIEMLFDLYSSQLLELDNRFEKYISQLGDWSGIVLDRFIDGGYLMFNRFFVYEFLGHTNSISKNPEIKHRYNRVVFIRIISVALLIFLVLLMLSQNKAANTFPFFAKLILLVEICIMVGVLLYAPAIEYWARSLTEGIFGYEDEVLKQVKFAVAELNELSGDINSLREEIAHYVRQIVAMSNEFSLKSNYETYITFGEVKRALLNSKILTPQKQDVLLYLMDMKSFLLLVKDYGFTFWILHRHFKTISILFVAILISCVFMYSGMIINAIPGLWTEITAILAADELFHVFRK